jgi:hypothetical protein
MSHDELKTTTGSTPHTNWLFGAGLISLAKDLVTLPAHVHRQWSRQHSIYGDTPEETAHTAHIIQTIEIGCALGGAAAAAIVSPWLAIPAGVAVYYGISAAEAGNVCVDVPVFPRTKQWRLQQSSRGPSSGPQ